MIMTPRTDTNNIAGGWVEEDLRVSHTNLFLIYCKNKFGRGAGGKKRALKPPTHEFASLLEVY